MSPQSPCQFGKARRRRIYCIEKIDVSGFLPTKWRRRNPAYNRPKTPKYLSARAKRSASGGAAGDRFNLNEARQIIETGRIGHNTNRPRTPAVPFF
jgi:hypothetical protein